MFDPGQTQTMPSKPKPLPLCYLAASACLTVLASACQMNTPSAQITMDIHDVQTTDAPAMQPIADADATVDTAATTETDTEDSADSSITLDLVDISPDTDAAIGPPCLAGTTTGLCEPVSQCNGKAVPGLCPGPADIQCCVAPWTCDPKAVPQPNVGLSTPPAIGYCPAGMLAVAGFCIDRFEASLVEVTASGATQPWSPYWNPAGHKVKATVLQGAVPQAYISGTQAKAACEAAGKRLCTDTEWLRACQGPAKYTYPYGNQLQLGVCNDHRNVHPAIELYATAASWIWSALDNPCLDQLPESLAATGSHPGCVTAEGAEDMMGNLHEWTADPAGTFRGGYYVDTKLNGPGCLYVTTAHDMGHWDYSTGFRCCADTTN